jgi:CRP/FNR family transcriptional regulator, cyclic AMP receptor protein
MTLKQTSRDDLEKILSEATFLGALKPQTRESLTHFGRVIQYPKGKQIFSRGEAGDSLHIIIAGEVKISTVTSDGHEVALNFLTKGDALGEIAVLDGGERTADAQALNDVEAFVLQRRDLLPALLAEPESLLEVVTILCAKLRATSEQVEDNTLDMTRRMARGLLRLMRQHGKRSAKGTKLSVTPSQRDLGLFTGLSRENVSRQISVLRQAGLVAVENNDIMILDEDRLSDVAEEGL